jgi:hypothetical protein
MEGMELLYDGYAEGVLFMISQIVPESEKSEEILIDVFEKIWNERNTLPESNEAFLMWLFRLTRTASFDSSDFRWMNN